jgi:hypothetical protein
MLTGKVAATPAGNPDYAKYDSMLRDYVAAVRAVPVPDVSGMAIVEGILKQGRVIIEKGLEFITQSIQD